jgi:5-methylcytosine-specific restriction endonuclease McrA
VCEETKPSTNEFFHYKNKKTGRLDRTCKVCDNNRKNKWNKENPEKKRKQGRDTFAKNYDKWKSNKAWVMKRRVSTTVANTMKKRGVSKNHQTWKTLPYSPEQLKEHLENQFDSKMTWDNYGTYWHIDHIYPQSLLPYDSLEHPNFQKCWALENLRPLEAKANIKKGNKVD